MPLEIIAKCLLIIVARITDVSLGTLRTVFIVHGRKGIAFVVGFIEILIWLVVISSVIKNLDKPIYAVSYAFGFGLGTYVGITIEAWLKAGEQVIRTFTRKGGEIATGLRSSGYIVTQFEGTGREGPISLLFLKTDRRKVAEVVDYVTGIDPDCFYIIDNVRLSSGRKIRYQSPTGWRAILKKK
ncbi:MAG: DUF2179 domain-containing protein [Deltaproteobacteria bacterium]|nr:DUF2179 domain-containing protein [Deltaproteobacteria bacterium]